MEYDTKCEVVNIPNDCLKDLMVRQYVPTNFGAKRQLLVRLSIRLIDAARLCAACNVQRTHNSCVAHQVVEETESL